MAHRDAAPLDRFVAGGTFLQSRERLVDRCVINRDLLAAEREARIVARIDGRHRFEARRELQRLAFLDDDVANVGRVDGLDAAFAQGLVHRTRDETVCDVVENLIAEPLAHHLRRHLAGTEPGILAARL